MITTFDRLCSLECSTDYWTDLAVGQAIEVLDEFKDEDWSVLVTFLPTRSNLWLKRCAEALGGSDSAKAFVLLLQLCKHTDSNVVVAALDSLNTILHNRSILLRNESCRAQIQNSIDTLKHYLQTHPSNPVALMLESLQDKLKN